MITLKQLAELSGLSVRTVGRALSGNGYVAPEKKALVQALAKKHNYTPNLAARNLRLQKKKCVGIINNSYRLTANARKLSMLTRKLTTNGYWPLLGNAENPEICRNMLCEWSALAEYVIVLRVVHQEVLDIIEQAARTLPLKFIFADCPQASVKNIIAIDRTGSVCNMLEELDCMQVKSLVYCGGINDRLEGIRMAQAAGVKIKITMLESIPEFEAGYALGAKVMQSGADVAFFDTDRMAMGFYRYAAENGIVIPDDISVIGFDDEEFAALATPGLSSLAHPHQKIADCAVQMISENQISSAELLKMDFIKRSSLKIPSTN